MVLCSCCEVEWSLPTEEDAGQVDWPSVLSVSQDGRLRRRARIATKEQGSAQPSQEEDLHAPRLLKEQGTVFQVERGIVGGVSGVKLVAKTKIKCPTCTRKLVPCRCCHRELVASDADQELSQKEKYKRPGELLKCGYCGFIIVANPSHRKALAMEPFDVFGLFDDEIVRIQRSRNERHYFEELQQRLNLKRRLLPNINSDKFTGTPFNNNIPLEYVHSTPDEPLLLSGSVVGSVAKTSPRQNGPDCSSQDPGREIQRLENMLLMVRDHRLIDLQRLDQRNPDGKPKVSAHDLHCLLQWYGPDSPERKAMVAGIIDRFRYFMSSYDAIVRLQDETFLQRCVSNDAERLLENVNSSLENRPGSTVAAAFCSRKFSNDKRDTLATKLFEIQQVCKCILEDINVELMRLFVQAGEYDLPQCKSATSNPPEPWNAPEKWHDNSTTGNSIDLVGQKVALWQNIYTTIVSAIR